MNSVGAGCKYMNSGTAVPLFCSGLLGFLGRAPGFLRFLGGCRLRFPLFRSGGDFDRFGMVFGFASHSDKSIGNQGKLCLTGQLPLDRINRSAHWYTYYSRQNPNSGLTKCNTDTEYEYRVF